MSPIIETTLTHPNHLNRGKPPTLTHRCDAQNTGADLNFSPAEKK